MTVDEQLAAMSTEQLRRGLKRGKDQLAMLVPIMFGASETGYFSEDYDAKGPPSAAFERWVNNFTNERERLLKLGIRDVMCELSRRGETTDERILL